MGNTNENSAPVVTTNEEYEAKIKELEKKLKASEKERKAQETVIKEQETTLKAQAEEIEKGKSAPAASVATPVKSFVSEDNHKKYRVKLPLNKQLGDKVVMVNDLKYVVKRGVEVEVPEWVKEALDHEEEMQLVDYDHQANVEAKLKMF